jgi:hypothetical protein
MIAVQDRSAPVICSVPAFCTQGLPIIELVHGVGERNWQDGVTCSPGPDVSMFVEGADYRSELEKCEGQTTL